MQSDIDVSLFQAHVISDRGEDMISLGQHHVTIDKADNIFTSYPFVLVSRIESQAR